MNTLTNFITPSWVKDAVFYQIFPDRFAASPHLSKPDNLEPWDSEPTVNGFKGGDLLGVCERLDYLQDLGINAIYFNPIFQSASNHRYHTHDYMKVDPILGGDRVFFELLDQAHRRGIRVILDGVFNHASRGFFQFNHILECGASSPYVDWFTTTKFPLNAYGAYGQDSPGYRCWKDLPALPAFNIANPQVRQYLFAVARYWLDQGIDGWRLDVPFEITDDSFWQEFRQVVKATNPDAYIFGEVPWEAQQWLQGDQFDGVMNYQFTQACVGFFGGQFIDRELEHNMMGLPSAPEMDAKAFAQRVEQLLKIYPRPAVLAQLNLIDSHDMPRFLALVSGRKDLLKMAVLFQMTYPGAPCVYYGDEIGIPWGRTRTPEDSRYAFPWDPEKWDNDLRKYFRKMITLRKAYRALRDGEFTSLYAEGGVYAYMRHNEDEKLVVVLNNQPSSYHLEVPVGGHLHDETYLVNLFASGSARVVDGRITRLALGPFSGIVFAT